jgi:hypothetical protein
MPILAFLISLIGSDFQNNEYLIAANEANLAILPPCEELRVTSPGVVCKSRFGFEASLAFPQVNLEGALAGNEYLPQVNRVFTADAKIVHDKPYRDIAIELRWEPNTPEFLQIYLDEYLKYWGNRIPYRLFWSARYEECSTSNCAEWVTVNEQGEFLPSDIKTLQNDLAADVNFNGVPAAFWNTNVFP